MKLSNLKISTRLAMAFAALFLGAMALAGTGWYGIRQQALLTNLALDKDVEFARSIANLRARVQMLRRFEKDAVLNVNNADKVAQYKKQWDDTRKRVDELLANARTASVTDAERGNLDLFAKEASSYFTSMEQVYGAMAAGKLATSADAYHKIEEFRQVIRDTEKVTGELFEGANKRIDGVKPALADIEKKVLLILAFSALAVLALAAAISAVITRSITRPIAEAVRIAEALAKGDLSQKVEVHSKDEMGRLMQALQGTVGQLSGIVGRIKETSDTVSTASREIAQGNADLSTRTEQQASALEETSASMQQMTATVGQNAQNAKKANELAAQASDVAAKGGAVVREAVSTMNGITESSKKIADIIGVIDGIAFQTNILALNAAVEAARAGEQGRGFAVVASEVRSLAQRSAAAAKEIKGLITDSVDKVGAGSRQVNDAGRTMEEIVASVKKVGTLIAEITAASQEQAQGIEQVSETMTQLEKVTQQNAAMVEEASAAAGSLEEQSRTLSSAVATFRLNGEMHVAQALKPALKKTPEVLPKQPLAEAKRPQLSAPIAKAAARKSAPAREEGWQEF